MRICEIEDLNKSIIILSNMEIEFSAQYKRILLSYKMLYKIYGRTADPILASYVTELKNSILKFLNYEFYPDSDIDLLKKQAFDLFKKLDQFN